MAMLRQLGGIVILCGSPTNISWVQVKLSVTHSQKQAETHSGNVWN